MTHEDRRPPTVGIAFLLAQLGAYATSRYAERVARLDLSPAQTGILRLIAQRAGQSQQTLAVQLGVVPSKVVTLVDDLQTRELLERQRRTSDRRNYELHLTPKGGEVMGRLREAARQHEQDITAALTDGERRQLAVLLRKIADQQGLTPGVHPGYRAARGRAPEGREPPPTGQEQNEPQPR